MLRRVVDFSLDNRWIVLSLAVAVIAFGLYTMWNIPIEAFTTGLPGGRKIHRLNPWILGKCTAPAALDG
jgi:Cu/Ag efflux pump CusA